MIVPVDMLSMRMLRLAGVMPFELLKNVNQDSWDRVRLVDKKKLLVRNCMRTVF